MLEALIDSYIAVWNETDGAARYALVTKIWEPDARYIDPMTSGQGHDGIDAMIGAAQGQFPGMTFSRRGTLDAFGDRVRFSWDLGPAGAAPVAGGTDFAVVTDGRFANVTGFLDFTPG
ncbi:nuclear transport factor 2 family protein [Phenylobacterium sp.]|uniref:nuclear transport factor 2 family protein n=1 Tax=Phenylobacterium sp. TaxID=1871053 RepID=UPI0030F40961